MALTGSGRRSGDILDELYDYITRVPASYYEVTTWVDGVTPMSAALCDRVTYRQDFVKGRTIYYRRQWPLGIIDMASYGIIDDGKEHDELQAILDRYEGTRQTFLFPRGKNILIPDDLNFYDHTLIGMGPEDTILRVKGMKGPRSVKGGNIRNLQISSRGLDQSIGRLPAGQYPGTNTYKGVTRYFSQGNDGDGISIDEESLLKLVLPDFFVRDLPLPDGVYPNATWPAGSYWELPSHPKPKRYAVQTSRAYSPNPYDHNQGYGLGIFSICDVRNVIVTGFPIGINIYGDVNFKSDPAAPNGYIADRCYFEKVSAQGCTFGWLFTGGDGNKNRLVSCEQRNIEVWGVLDNSLLGNYFDDHHSIDCGFGHYCVPTDSSFGMFNEPYGEAGNLTTGVNRPSRFGANTTVMGGPLASGYLFSGSAGGQTGSTQRKLNVGNLIATKQFSLGPSYTFYAQGDNTWKLSGGQFADRYMVVHPKNTAVQFGAVSRGNSPAGLAFTNTYSHGVLHGAIQDIDGYLYAATGSDDYNYNQVMFQPGDTLLNQRHDGYNNPLFRATRGGMVNPYQEGRTVTDLGNFRYQLSGPTTALQPGDWLVVNGNVTRITKLESPTVFQATAQTLGANNSPIAYQTPTFCAEGRGKGTTAQRPAKMRVDDAGWEYYDTTLKLPLYWSGTDYRDATGTTR